MAARRAAGRGRRGPPAARRPSRCRGTASSTLQQQPTKQAVSQPAAMVKGAAIRPGRIAPDLGPGERRSERASERARAHGHTQPEARTGAAKGGGEVRRV